MGKIKYIIEKDKKGFCVWVKDGKIKHWIIDGSTILKDNTFRVSKGKDWNIIVKKLKTLGSEGYDEYEVEQKVNKK
jgi:hypothetical protein